MLLGAIRRVTDDRSPRRRACQSALDIEAIAATGRIARRREHEHESADDVTAELERTEVATSVNDGRDRRQAERQPERDSEPHEQPNDLVTHAHPT